MIELGALPYLPPPKHDNIIEYNKGYKLKAEITLGRDKKYQKVRVFVLKIPKEGFVDP